MHFYVELEKNTGPFSIHRSGFTQTAQKFSTSAVSLLFRGAERRFDLVESSQSEIGEIGGNNSVRFRFVSLAISCYHSRVPAMRELLGGTPYSQQIVSSFCSVLR